MAFTVPPLPYEQNALEPYMSAKTLSYHYGKHNQAYNDTLNKLIAGTEYEKMPLEEIIRTTQSGPIFNNAAQCFNHTFFWNSMKPNGGGQPEGALADAINAKWGSFDAFADAFANSGSRKLWLRLDMARSERRQHARHRKYQQRRHSGYRYRHTASGG